MARRALGGAALGLAAAWAGAAPPGTGKGHVQARLVSEVESIRPGEPFQVGLHLRMEPEWHTYWRNPGDAGLPTRIAWTLPDGWSAAPIQWPYPTRFGEAVVSYGYEGEVLLPVRVTPSRALNAGHVTLTGRADWLECKEACLPGRASLSLTLPVTGVAPRRSAEAALFDVARARLPVEPAGWSVESDVMPQGLAFLLRPPRDFGPLRSAYFFPEDRRRLDHAAPQALERVADGYRLQLTPNPNAPKPLPALPGVLVAENGAGGLRAVRLSLRPAAGKTRPGGSPPHRRNDP
jgi:thiol:disulfide interchange protein DsbD